MADAKPAAAYNSQFCWYAWIQNGQTCTWGTIHTLDHVHVWQGNGFVYTVCAGAHNPDGSMYAGYECASGEATHQYSQTHALDAAEHNGGGLDQRLSGIAYY